VTTISLPRARPLHRLLPVVAASITAEAASTAALEEKMKAGVVASVTGPLQTEEVASIAGPTKAGHALVTQLLIEVPTALLPDMGATKLHLDQTTEKVGATYRIGSPKTSRICAADLVSTVSSGGRWRKLWRSARTPLPRTCPRFGRHWIGRIIRPGF